MGWGTRRSAAFSAAAVMVSMLVTVGGAGPLEAAPSCAAPVTRVAPAEGFVIQDPSVSADGTRIAFQSDDDLTGGNADGNDEIFLYDADGSTLTQLTSSTQGSGVESNWEPSISDDGTKVAFTSDRNYTGANATGYEIFLWSEAGSTITQLTDVAAFAFTVTPEISGDGSTVVFESDGNVGGLNPSLNYEVFVVNTATTAVTAVTSTVVEGGGQPTVSADGREVAFSSAGNLTGQNADGSTEVFLWDADGGPSTTQLTNATTGTADSPSVSAAGNRVAFRSNRANGTGAGDDNFEIFVRDVAAGTTAAVTTTARGGQNSNWEPSISADGSRVAFTSNRNIGGGNADGSYEIFVWDRAGAQVAQVTSGATDSQRSTYPSLAADGGTVAFVSGDFNVDYVLRTVACALPPRPDALIATSGAGPFKGGDVYAATVRRGQTKSQRIARGATRTFHVQLQNDHGVADTLKVKGVSSGSAGYTVRYLSGTTDITARVVAGSYSTGVLAPGAAVTIKVKVTASSTAAAGSARDVDVTDRSQTDTSVKDTVRARVTRS